MRNRPIFIKVKAFVDAQGYTIEQIQNATYAQIQNLLSLDDVEYQQYKDCMPAIKKLLIQDLQDLADTQTLADLKSQINTWLLARFPGYEVEKDFSDKANRRVTFYLDGRTE